MKVVMCKFLRLAKKFILYSIFRWSFSMLLYEIYSLGDVPMSHVKESGLFKALKKGDRPPRPDHASDEM